MLPKILIMKKYIKPTLKHTHETIDNIYEQYYDGQNIYSDNSEKILYIVNQLPQFEQDVFYLYCEYNSSRKVADETNVTRTTIQNIINKIKQLVLDCEVVDFSTNYISKGKELKNDK